MASVQLSSTLPCGGAVRATSAAPRNGVRHRGVRGTSSRPSLQARVHSSRRVLAGGESNGNGNGNGGYDNSMPLWQRIHGKPGSASTPTVPPATPVGGPEAPEGPATVDIAPAEAPLWQSVQSQIRQKSNSAPLWQQVHLFKKSADELKPPPVLPAEDEDSSSSSSTAASDSVDSVKRGSAPLWSSVHSREDTRPMWLRVSQSRDELVAQGNISVPFESDALPVMCTGGGMTGNDPEPEPEAVKKSWLARLLGGRRERKNLAAAAAAAAAAAEAADQQPLWARIHLGKKDTRAMWQTVNMRRSMGLDTAANDGPLVSPAVLINPNNDDDGPKLLDIKPSRTVPLWQRVHIDGKSIRDERRYVFGRWVLRLLSFALFGMAFMFIRAAILGFMYF